MQALGCAAHLGNALGAYIFVLEGRYPFGAAAENAGGLVFSQDNFIAFDENFDGVLFVDLQCAAQFYGDHDSAQVVHLAYYSGRLHLLATSFKTQVDIFTGKSIQSPRKQVNLFLVRNC